MADIRRIDINNTMTPSPNIEQGTEAIGAPETSSPPGWRTPDSAEIVVFRDRRGNELYRYTIESPRTFYLDW